MREGCRLTKTIPAARTLGSCSGCRRAAESLGPDAETASAAAVRLLVLTVRSRTAKRWSAAGSCGFVFRRAKSSSARRQAFKSTSCCGLLCRVERTKSTRLEPNPNWRAGWLWFATCFSCRSAGGPWSPLSAWWLAVFWVAPALPKSLPATCPGTTECSSADRGFPG